MISESDRLADPDVMVPEAAVVVVVVAYNSGPDLQKAVDALQRQSFRDFRLVVWDNASTDGSTDALALPPGAQLVRSPDNLGFAAANNRAAALRKSRWIACLNPDAFAEPDWLEQLVAAGERSGAASVGSVQLSDEDPTLLDGLGDVISIGGVAWRGGYLSRRDSHTLEPAEILSPCAAAALYRRDAWEAAGGFDERYFAYFEDVDLGLRLRLAGHISVLAPQAVVRHVGGGSSGKVSGFAQYYGMRNLVWTFAKTMPLAFWPIALPAHLVTVLVMCQRAWHNRTLRPWLRGVVDGWRGVAPFLVENRQRDPKHLGRVWPFLVFDPRRVQRRSAVLRPLSAPGAATAPRR